MGVTAIAQGLAWGAVSKLFSHVRAAIEYYAETEQLKVEICVISMLTMDEVNQLWANGFNLDAIKALLLEGKIDAAYLRAKLSEGRK